MGILRLFLAMSVAMQHAGGKWGIGGGLAVEVFFIISGFYMGLVLSSGKYQDYRSFITNRFLRIFPIYWVVVLFTVFISLLLIWSGISADLTLLGPYYNYGEHLNLGSRAFFLFSNIALFTQEWALFMGLDQGALYLTGNFSKSVPMVYSFLPAPQAWSLSLELLFYLIIPFLIWRKPKTSLMLLCGLTLLSFICKITLLSLDFSYDPWAYRFFPCGLHLFLLGVLAHQLYVFMLKRLSKQKIVYSIISIGLMAGVLHSLRGSIKAMIVGVREQLSPFQASMGEIFALTLRYSFPYLCAVFAICALFYLTSKNRWDRRLGELSYPLYITHFLVINIVSIFFPRDPIYFPYATTFISLLISAGLAYWLQAPIDRYRAGRVLSKRKQLEEVQAGNLDIQLA